MKTMFCITAGMAASAVLQIFGGWNFALLALLILMGLDFTSGLIVAGVFHKSKKSETGRIESKAALKGLIRKVMIVCLVVVAHLIDRLLGTNYVRDAVAIAFIVNEIISILENAGLMGLPIPGVLTKALEVLQKKSGEDADAGKIGEGAAAGDEKTEART